MLGCCSLATARASARIRSRDAASAARSTDSTFTATSRSSTTSRARQTTDMPPVPIGSSNRYLPPSCSPEVPLTTRHPDRFRSTLLPDRTGDSWQWRPPFIRNFSTIEQVYLQIRADPKKFGDRPRLEWASGGPVRGVAVGGFADRAEAPFAEVRVE